MNACEVLEGFHDRLLTLAKHLNFDKRQTLDLHRVALYGSTLELTRGICTLLKFDARLGVPSLFRSFLEASVELTNLLKDDGYIEHMDASHKEQWLKVLIEARAGKNAYLADIAKVEDLNEQIATYESELAKHRANKRGAAKRISAF